MYALCCQPIAGCGLIELKYIHDGLSTAVLILHCFVSWLITKLTIYIEDVINISFRDLYALCSRIPSFHQSGYCKVYAFLSNSRGS